MCAIDTIKPLARGALAARGTDPPLDALAVKWGADQRVMAHDDPHCFERMWCHLRHDPVSLLQIGVRGGESIRGWEGFFTRARIVGLDIDPRCAALGEPRTRVIIGSQDDLASACRVRAVCPQGFDIIVDGGSHLDHHQQAAFALFFTDLLKPGGFYVIRDLHRADHAQTKGHAPQSTLDFLKDRIADTVHRNPAPRDPTAASPRIAPLPTHPAIESITFIRGIAVIVKSDGEA